MFLLSLEGSETITFLWPKWCKRLIQRFPIIPAPRTRILESAVTEPVFCNLFQSMSCGTICKFLQVLCGFKENVLEHTSCGQVQGMVSKFVEYILHNSKLVTTYALTFSRAWVVPQFDVAESCDVRQILCNYIENVCA